MAHNIYKTSTAHAQSTLVYTVLIIINVMIPGDENRQLLMTLGALDPLLRLVASEDKVVKRNAAMCLGTLTQNGNNFYRLIITLKYYTP